jgi:hypothetical protein
MVRTTNILLRGSIALPHPRFNRSFFCTNSAETFGSIPFEVPRANRMQADDTFQDGPLSSQPHRSKTTEASLPANGHLLATEGNSEQQAPSTVASGDDGKQLKDATSDPGAESEYAYARRERALARTPEEVLFTLRSMLRGRKFRAASKVFERHQETLASVSAAPGVMNEIFRLAVWIYANVLVDPMITQEQQLEKAYQLLEDMKQRNIEADAKTYAAFMFGATALRRRGLAEKALEMMKNDNVLPLRETHEALVRMYAEIGDYDAAFVQYKNLVQQEGVSAKSSAVLVNLIKTILERPDQQQFATLLREMSARLTKDKNSEKKTAKEPKPKSKSKKAAAEPTFLE